MLDPKPQTPNPKPQTPNPKARPRSAMSFGYPFGYVAILREM